MKVDRRQFIQLGAITVLSGSACGGGSPEPAASLKRDPVAAGPELAIAVQGLYVIEPKGQSMLVHIVDGPAVGMPKHVCQLKALASQVDQSQTQKPDPSHIIPAGASDEFWLWDLKGNSVTGPPSDSGADDLTSPPENASEDGQDIPSAAGWNSLHRLPDLKQCCGATKVSNMGAIASTISLKHGRVEALKPADVAGPGAVWSVTGPSQQSLLRGALSNNVKYVSHKWQTARSQSRPANRLQGDRG